MQLNYKRTILVGLAFFSICAFWQMYDNIIPLVLKNTFGLGDTVAGVIMSLDNILALFLLPFFGALSDRAGRRMPFILGGTALAVVLCVVLPFFNQPGSLRLFMVALGLLLVAMSIYRSPAVALMPDLTPKPLRSKANAVINLMGALGGVYTLIAIRMLVKQPAGNNLPDYLPLFICVAAIMVASVALLYFTIRETDIKKEAEAPQEAGSAGGEDSLEPPVRRSLYLILFSVAFWFMGYNAITSAFTKYAEVVWGHNVSQASTCLLIAMAGAVVSYIPIGFIASRVGRKRTVLAGVAILAACFAAGGIIAGGFSPSLYVVFALIGFSWAAINVNSYPMVVEISKLGSVGKYTGYYYTFSMAAQIFTPILSGALLEHVGYHTLFPYAAFFVALSFVTMSFARHGDNKPVPKGRLEAFEDM